MNSEFIVEGTIDSSVLLDVLKVIITIYFTAT